MIVAIENDFLIVKVKPKGAELNSLFNKQTQLEYMWSGDPAVWGKTSPILFPIVGTLKEDAYHFKNKMYTLSRHGFARDMVFEIEKQEKNAVTFLLKSSDISLEKYPFNFLLRVKYELDGNSLSVNYFVENTGDTDMYFSLGAHPAFKVPLVENSKYEDHYLTFNSEEDLNRWPISKDGLIEAKPVLLKSNAARLDLTKDLFKQDALVFKHLHSDVIALKSIKDEHGLDFMFNGFPFMGIWAAPNANFVCIEPWCGIADSVNHDQQLETKEGINVLSPASSWKRMWKVKLY
jgi:galactose mutarotase-like enzyme